MKKVLSLLLCCFICVNIFAQENVTSENQIIEVQKKSELSHAQVATMGYVPYFGTYVMSASQFLWPSQLIAHGLSLESTLLNIPAAIVNPSYTLTGTAIDTGLFASGLLCEKNQDIYGNPSLANTLWNMGYKGNMWLQYKGYETARTRCNAEIYQNCEVLDFKDAVFSCFNPDVLSKKTVWIPILTNATLYTGYLCFGGFDNSIFKTGKAYVGKYSVPVVAGVATVLGLSCLNFISTGIGEEALFRGVGYEEMKVSMGIVPAKIIDALGFSTCHVPQSVLSGIDPITILLGGVVYQSGLTLLLQWAYDKGGLRDSIAAHMWMDVLNALATYLFTSGIEDNNFALSLNFSINL